MCVLSIKVPIRNQFGNLSYAPRKSTLDDQRWHVYVLESTRKCHSWVCLYFSSSYHYVLFVFVRANTAIISSPPKNYFRYNDASQKYESKDLHTWRWRWFFNIVSEILQGDTSAPYTFRLCLDYVRRTSVYIYIYIYIYIYVYIYIYIYIYFLLTIWKPILAFMFMCELFCLRGTDSNACLKLSRIFFFENAKPKENVTWMRSICLHQRISHYLLSSKWRKTRKKHFFLLIIALKTNVQPDQLRQKLFSTLHNLIFLTRVCDSNHQSSRQRNRILDEFDFNSHHNPLYWPQVDRFTFGIYFLEGGDPFLCVEIAEILQFLTTRSLVISDEE